MTNVKVSLKVSCGCGFKTEKLEEAVKHSEESRHQLTIGGSVLPNKEVAGR